MTVFTLEQLLDFAEAEGRARYAEGYRAGLEAGEQHQASEWAELTADALDEQTHAAARAVVAGLVGSPVSRAFASIGVDPVTADGEVLRQVAAFWRHCETQRVRGRLAEPPAVALAPAYLPSPVIEVPPWQVDRVDNPAPCDRPAPVGGDPR